ncbi:MAG: hypothetical protein NVS4B12_02370 [Ktedonobacteraceae bacterium]
MEDASSWTTSEDEEIFTLSEQDELGVLSSTRNVLEQGEHVWIVTDNIERLSTQWIHELVSASGQPPSSPLWDNTYHFYDGTERTVNWLLLLDALNFCFWAEKGRERWRISYKGEILNGYWAEAASLTRAVEEGIPLWNADYLCTISEDAIASIFCPVADSDPIPLLEQRVLNAREVGRVLQEKYEGQFVYAIEQTQHNAIELVRLLARNFSSFNDVVLYRNREVRFFKRAQICVADMYGSFGGKQWGAFTDLHKLTIFADYKLPQILRHYGVLTYDPLLAEVVDNQQLLEPGSEEEVEIRAATLWACELLRREMQRRGHSMNALEIDQKLWSLSQRTEHMRPYHRVRTQYY